MNSLEKIEKFRKQPYQILGNARDALFDLMDAVLTTRQITSFVELSLSPAENGQVSTKPFKMTTTNVDEGIREAHS